MSLLKYALDQVRNEVPGEILREAFASRRYDPAKGERHRDNLLGMSIEAVIQKQVIEGRVSIDVNLCSGVETSISLAGIRPEMVDSWNYIYRIPDALTGGRSITAAYSVVFGQGYAINNINNITPHESSMLSNAAQGILRSVTPIPNIQTPYVTIISENTILVSDVQGFNPNMWLNCMLTHEPNFTNIKPPYYRKFAELVVLATKAAIYNQLVILLDEGQIKSGSNIGRFREIVDGYADANQLYKEFLHDKWRVSAVCNDTGKYRQILKMAVGGLR